MITCIDAARIAVIAFKSTRTVERTYRGVPCKSTTRAAIERAAKKLRLPLPPPAASAPRPSHCGDCHPMHDVAHQNIEASVPR